MVVKDEDDLAWCKKFLVNFFFPVILFGSATQHWRLTEQLGYDRAGAELRQADLQCHRDSTAYRPMEAGRREAHQHQQNSHG